MNELELKYGCNPNQKPARVFMKNGAALPFTVLNGKPGYINLLDAFNSWQLVRELKEATGQPAAASFKHVSPAGAALGLPLDEVDKRVYFVAPDAALSPIACAYIRARGADRLCSYGDWAALSDECDAATAAYLKNEVSDGIIAPSFSEEALVILKTKKGGKYNIVQIDPAYVPAPLEQKDVFGITFEQGHNDCKIDESLLTNIVTENKDLPKGAKRDMLLALITLKYTQSNSVCYVKDAQTVGVGAGQQSRIHCTRLAGQKADNWYLRRHPKVLALSFVDGIRRRVAARLSGAPRGAHGRGKARLARAAARRDRRLGRLFPLRRQCRARAQERRFLHRRAGRLDPRRQCHQDGEQSRHHYGVHGYAPVPSLSKEEFLHEAHGHRRRRPRTRHH